nr:altered inheritance of mitochondria protein 32-like [Tanacetum cinerariifolium]
MKEGTDRNTADFAEVKLLLKALQPPTTAAAVPPPPTCGFSAQTSMNTGFTTQPVSTGNYTTYAPPTSGIVFTTAPLVNPTAPPSATYTSFSGLRFDSQGFSIPPWETYGNYHQRPPVSNEGSFRNFSDVSGALSIEKGLKESDIKSFVEEVIVNRKLWSTGVQVTMTGSHVFVCSHSSRDKMCGYCEPILIKKFKEEAELRGLENVSVTAFSNVGGHKYAGNLIIYSVRDAKVSGHWFGYVTPSDVPELLDNHIGKGEIIDRSGGAKWAFLLSRKLRRSR